MMNMYRQSVRQKHTVWVFCQWQTRIQAVRRKAVQGKQWPNGNADDRRLFGERFEPRSGEDGSGAAADSPLTTIRTADLKVCSWLRYHSTGVCCDSMCIPTAWSLGVCYANDPKKGGVYDARACA